MSGLQELLARVEAATGGDQQLVADLYNALGDQAVDRGKLSWAWRPGGVGFWQNLPPLLTSLDAALALVERVLPGSRSMVETTFERSGWAMIHVAPGAGRDMAHGNTPALALLAAMLKALIPQSDSHPLSKREGVLSSHLGKKADG